MNAGSKGIRVSRARSRVALLAIAVANASCLDMTGAPNSAHDPADAVERVTQAFTAGPGFSNVDRTTTAVGSRIGPVMSLGKHFNMPHAVNKTLFLAGNGDHEIWNISNPTAPARMSTMLSPNRFGEAESHQLSFSLFPDGTIHAATISGKGVDIWNISNPSSPSLEKAVTITGVNYGDFTNAVWGVFFQGKYVYVGGTNTGLHIIDATTPASASVVKTVPNSAFGNISAGPLFAIGNLLVITTPKENSGIATMDISDPINPVLLDFVDPAEKSYFGSFYGTWAFLQSPFTTWDVTTDPKNIVKVGSFTTSKSEYMTFGEGPTLFLGSLRTNSGGIGGVLKYANITNWNSPPTPVHIAGRNDSGTDDQFAIPIGNLLPIADDERLFGAQLTLHKQTRDSTAPTVMYVNPPNNATNINVKSRIGVSFSDQMELTSATTSSFIVRPVGSSTAVTGRWGIYHTVMSFSPDAPLASGTQYEIVLPAGGMKDLVGNGIAAQFRSVFTTTGTAGGPPCAINATTPVTTGSNATLSASSPNTTLYNYNWNFGDGTTGTGTSVTKSYTNPNRYAVRLTVQDKAVTTKTTTCSTVQIVHRPLTTNLPTRTNTLAKAGGDVWVVNPDDNSIAAISTSTLTKVREVNVGANPRTLAERPGSTEEIWVANQDSDSISVVNPSTGAIITTLSLPRGSQPYGVVFDNAGNNAYVTLQGLGRLLKFNAGTRAQSGSLDLGPINGIVPMVRGIATNHDGTRVFVTRFISPSSGGEIYEVSASTMTKVRTITLGNSTRVENGDQGRGIPNYLSNLAISPDNVKMFVPSKQDNMSRGMIRDGKPLTFDTTIRPIVSRVDLGANTEDASARVDLNDADLPVANWISPKGDLVFVAVQGTNLIHVMNAYTGEVAGGFTTDLAPQGLWHDNGRLYVQNFMSRNVTVHDISGLLAGTSSTAAELAAIGTVASEPLSAQVLQGKRIFYNADDARMSKDGYISCASCHLDGIDDGRVWDFKDRGEGFRNTASLQGRGGLGMGPVHWTGNFDEIQDFENDIRNGFGGTGFMSSTDFTATNDPLGAPKAGKSADLDALAAYVGSLKTVPKSPYRDSNGTLSADGRAGRQIFLARDCSNCHGGPRFMDSNLNTLHNVGTITTNSGTRRNATLTGFDTPTLLGAWSTPPYFHDGSAATFYDVINRTGHGNAQALTTAEKDKLVAYLKQIDETESTPSLTALLIVGNPGGMSTGDTAIRSRLQGLGYTVTTADEDTVTSASASDMDLVVIAESCSAAVIGNKMDAVDVPVLVLDGGVWDDMRMAGVNTGTSQTQINIISSNHRLAAKMSGTISVATASSTIDYATTFGSGAEKVASIVGQSTQVVLFTYRAGTAMVSGTAPARRTGYSLHSSQVNANMHEQAWIIFDEAVRMTAGEFSGLRGDYYDENNLTQWKLSRVDPVIDFNWGTGSPHANLGNDNFSVRWSGEVMPPTTGTYTFYVRSDDGARLWVNGTLVIDKWVNQGPTEWSGTISLTAGQRYSIKLEYYDATNGAEVDLSWSTTGVAKRSVPAARLLPAR